ncbi:hypothetical protein ILUMI_24062 [Ignelater luminosus]|uniref:Uncharacterized protein n=1 Tax=Ignelater luminosus TaxID=2038154 RepID=A0A8K0C9T3_IGNLU|nr:hypothetical protein ILUMI_24062 [Ignelater luminosus]
MEPSSPGEAFDWTTLSFSVRKRFWALECRNLAKQIVHTWLDVSETTGGDYARPILVKERKGRDAKVSKRKQIMDIDRLLVDELNYELLVRGIPWQGSVADKRKLLRATFRLEESGNLALPDFELNDKEKLQTCGDTLILLQAEVGICRSTARDNKYKRCHDKLPGLNTINKGEIRMVCINKYVVYGRQEMLTGRPVKIELSVAEPDEPEVPPEASVEVAVEPEERMAKHFKTLQKYGDANWQNREFKFSKVPVNTEVAAKENLV